MNLNKYTKAELISKIKTNIKSKNDSNTTNYPNPILTAIKSYLYQI